MTEQITDQDIRDDIERFERKIMRLKCQLMDLPPAHSRKDRKKAEALHQEILHIQELKQMAQDALDGKFGNALSGNSCGE